MADYYIYPQVTIYSFCEAKGKARSATFRIYFEDTVNSNHIFFFSIGLKYDKITVYVEREGFTAHKTIWTRKGL